MECLLSAKRHVCRSIHIRAKKQHFDNGIRELTSTSFRAHLHRAWVEIRLDLRGSRKPWRRILRAAAGTFLMLLEKRVFEGRTKQRSILLTKSEALAEVIDINPVGLIFRPCLSAYTRVLSGSEANQKGLSGTFVVPITHLQTCLSQESRPSENVLVSFSTPIQGQGTARL